MCEQLKNLMLPEQNSGIPFVASARGNAEPAPSASLAERGYNILRWTVMPRGGHFAAMGQPRPSRTGYPRILPSTALGSRNGQTDELEPIENYGAIGNMRSIALVGVNGSIEFFAIQISILPPCLPRCSMMREGAVSRFSRSSKKSAYGSCI